MTHHSTHTPVRNRSLAAAPAVTIVGGGLAGLTAAIACAEGGARVTLHEAHTTLGGRARTTPGPYLANDGTHAFYSDGRPWRWLAARGLHKPYAMPGVRALARLRFKRDDRLRALPPRALAPAVTRRSLKAPVDESYGSWAARQFGEESAHALGNLVGILTYEADPGRLSAAFVWERVLRITTPQAPAARYLVGGWAALIGRMATHARDLGVRIETGSRVDTLPEHTPVIVATTLAAAGKLLGEQSLHWESGRAALFDLGFERRRGDLFLISDLDDGGFLDRYSLVDPTIAPGGHALVQAEMPMRAGEPKAAALARLHRLADLAAPGWRDRTAWTRDAVATGRTGALDLPGTTWRDRPAVDRGDGVFLAGDMTAAPGLLCEVSVHSALEAARGALRVAPGRVGAGVRASASG